jgi:hypothetical protein
MRWSARSPHCSRSRDPPQAHLIGRRERLDCLHAALVNGMSAHVLDFDDTHLRTLLHPSVPVASSLLALAGLRPMSGAEFVHAFVLGVEVECRIANAIYPSHNVNWYITGTAGVFGAACGGRTRGRSGRAADDVGVRHCRDAGRRTARDVGHHVQELRAWARRAERHGGGDAGGSRLYELGARARGAARFCARVGGRVRSACNDGRAGRELRNPI